MEAPPERLRRWIPSGTPLYRAGGCPDCAMTGYRGRFSILEILTMTPELERLIAAGEAANKIADAAQRGGMKSLWDSGLAHVTRGESTLDELTRVVDIPDEPEPPPAVETRASRGSAGWGVHPRRDVHVPPEPAAPVSTVFDLLEEHTPPARRSGAHGSRRRRCCWWTTKTACARSCATCSSAMATSDEARDGVQALDQVDRVGPDIIVLDLNCPASTVMACCHTCARVRPPRISP